MIKSRNAIPIKYNAVYGVLFLVAYSIGFSKIAEMRKVYQVDLSRKDSLTAIFDSGLRPKISPGIFGRLEVLATKS